LVLVNTQVRVSPAEMVNVAVFEATSPPAPSSQMIEVRPQPVGTASVDV